MTVGADLPLGAESGAAGKAAPVVTEADPTIAETSLPLPMEYERFLSGSASPCTGAFCEFGTVDILLAVTVGFVFGFVLIAGTFHLVNLLWAIAWRGFGLLRHALSSGLNMIARTAGGCVRAQRRRSRKRGVDGTSAQRSGVQEAG